MTTSEQSRNVCRSCGRENEPDAESCASCGSDLNLDVELTHVDPDRRVELTRFETERGDEAELACGLLRANGIACELGNPALPGLPADLIVWVNPEDVRAAEALVEDSQREAQLDESEEDEAA